MIGWMDGGQIWIALERSSSESNKDVMSISVSHLIWKEEICFKNEVPGPERQAVRHINSKGCNSYFIYGTVHKSAKTDG